MNHTRDPLDALLADLPQEAEPSRDLWRDIKAQIEADAPRGHTPIHTHAWFQLAAAVLLVVASSLITFFVVQGSMQKRVVQARQDVTQQMQPVLSAMPVRFDGYEALGKSYDEARAQLDAEYEKRIQHLPPIVRAKVERDIA